MRVRKYGMSKKPYAIPFLLDSIVRGQCPDRHSFPWEGGANELLNGQLIIILKEKMAAYHNILVVCIQGFVFLFHSH